MASTAPRAEAPARPTNAVIASASYDARSARAARALSWSSHEDARRTQSGQGAARRSSSQPRSSYAIAGPGQHTGARAPGLPGGRKAIAAFVLSLVAYTVQTEFAQHVQQTLNYKKPFFCLYVGHSAFTLILPTHLLLLKLTTGRSIRKHYMRLIADNLRWQTDEPTLFKRVEGQAGAGSQLPSHANGKAGPSMQPESGLKAFFKDLVGFDLARYVLIIGILTIGITVPALSWYAAVPMTSMADITALYNCFAVAALVFSVWFLGDKWQAYKIFSVLLAVGGVVIVSYGGAEAPKGPRPVDPVKGAPGSDPPSEFPHPLLGDMLALLGAVTMGLYEIGFKLIGTLPDEELQMQLYGQGERISQRTGESRRRVHSTHSYIEYRAVEEELDAAEEEEDAAADGKLAQGSSPPNYQSMGTSQPESQRASLEASKSKGNGAAHAYIEEVERSSEAESELDDADLEEIGTGGSTRLSRTPSRPQDSPQARTQQQSKRFLNEVPPPLPFGLHANLITSSIGIMTFFTLWTGAVMAHYIGWERFEAPHNFETVLSIAIVAICGVFFNASFMILLSIWGPVLASVSCLLTTVLVQIADVLLGRPLHTLSLIGCAFIGMGFVVLIAGERNAHSH